MNLTPTHRGIAVAAALGGLALAVAAPVYAAPQTATSPTAVQKPVVQGTAVQKAAPHAAPKAAASALKWGACPASADAPRGTSCATLKVPLDYAKPSGRQITLTLSIFGGSASAPHTLVVNPGGPGEPGIGTAQMVATTLPSEVSEQYNVVGFDPRGVGASTAVSCGDTKALTKHPGSPYTPATARQEEQRRTVARKIADQCQAESGDLLPYITTENAARDLDRIRAALGRDKLDYLGYSYGTELGATYATLYPAHTGRMILDSVMDPTVTRYGAGFEQNPALQHRAEQFFTWAAKYDGSYHLGTTRAKVEAAWQAARKKLAAKPAEGRAGSAELDDLLASGMYTDVMWPDLAAAVSDYRGGDDGALLSATDQVASDGVPAAQLAYNCVDTAWPRTWQTWHDDTAAAARQAPLFAWLNTWYSAPCAYWHAPTAKPVKIGSVKVPPALLLQAADDAATPLAGARRMHKALTGSRLVVAGGGNHGQYLFGGNTCMDGHGTRYLLTGKLPAKDTTCKGVAAPKP